MWRRTAHRRRLALGTYPGGDHDLVDDQCMVVIEPGNVFAWLAPGFGNALHLAARVIPVTLSGDDSADTLLKNARGKKVIEAHLSVGGLKCRDRGSRQVQEMGGLPHRMFGQFGPKAIFADYYGFMIVV